MYRGFSLLAVAGLTAGCAFTSVEPMAQDTFKVATVTAPVCGGAAARKAAYRNAAIEVIRRGGDRFVIESNQGGQEFGGMVYNSYTGMATPMVRGKEGLVVKMLKAGDPNYANGLSARQTLGPDWQAIVAKGPSNTC